MSLSTEALKLRHALPTHSTWANSLIADIVDLSLKERLMQFVANEESEPIQLFSEEWRANEDSGDWYGEHAGKWLVAASAAFKRTGSTELGAAIVSVVGFLVKNQEPNGYLGTYSKESEARFTHARSSEVRTWDLWIHAWLILGLLDAESVDGVEGAKEAAVRAGELIVTHFDDPKLSVLDIGNHLGLSSAIVIEPLARLALETGDDRFANLALRIVSDLDRDGVRLSEDGRGVAELGTGKIYQICWMLVGLTALYRATGDSQVLEWAERYADDIAEHHLTPFGGPWGGVGTHKEVFNRRGFFSPYGMVETCSVVTWMKLCRELFLLTGRTIYVDRFERSFLNGLLGAIDENGSDWCYFTFPNGRRNNTYHWACCKSSGAMGLEDSSSLMVTVSEAGPCVNLYLSGESKVEFDTKSIGFSISEVSDSIAIDIDCEPQKFQLSLRVPPWAASMNVQVNGDSFDTMRRQEGYVRVDREWVTGDRVTCQLAKKIVVEPFTFTVDHHGQEVVRMDYAYLSYGPYVYATGLIDGYRKEETLRLPRLSPASPFRLLEDRTGAFGPDIELRTPARAPIRFSPYAMAGGRHDGAWRMTWLQVAWQ